MRKDFNSSYPEIKTNNEDKLRNYIDFMYNPDNIKNCNICPEKRIHTGYDQLPCGQYNCWVSIHLANR